MPKLEQEHPERNDKPLKELADGTGGIVHRHPRGDRPE